MSTTKEDIKIELKDVTKSYYVGQQSVCALNGVNLSIRNGEFLVVKGVSGSGKSTLLNILGNLDIPTSGKVLVDGIDLSTLSKKESNQYRLNRIGFIFQSFYLLPHLKVKDNVALPMVVANKKKRKERVLELLHKVGLSNRVNHYPNELSGGEQQRVAIARAIANETDIILADEPTGNLDETNEKNVIEFLQQLSRTGVTVIVSTHNQVMEQAASRVIMLEHGSMVIAERKDHND